MSSFFENQSLQKKLKFIHNDENKKVEISFNLKTNHEIDKNIIVQIENNINSLFLNNYMKQEDYFKNKEIEKEQNKNYKQKEKEDDKPTNKKSSKVRHLGLY
jgi:hypothetical protein